jgi:RNA polymerase sigma-70 factor (ECF subfamily)
MAKNVDLLSVRYPGLEDGRFQRKSALDLDRRPGELDAAIARAREGDQDAIRYLYLRFAGNVYGYVRSILRDDHDAEDVTQQVFARVLPALPSYESRGIPFSAWLLRIAQNTAIDHMRRRVTVIGEPDKVERITDDRARELVGALRDALDELPTPQRTVVVMRHVAGLGPREIAKVLDCTEASIHGLHHRGRRALQDSLSQAGVRPMTAAA